MERWDSVAKVVALSFFVGFLLVSYAASPPPRAPDEPGLQPVSDHPFLTANVSVQLFDVRCRLDAGTAFTVSTPVTASVENESLNTTPLPVENTTPPAPEYDDEVLTGVIANSSIPLMMLSIQSIYSLYYWDEGSVHSDGAKLHDSAAALLPQVASLQISPEQEHLKETFVAALNAYVLAGAVLKEGSALNDSEVDTAFNGIMNGTHHLRLTIDNLSTEVQIPEEIDGIEQLALRSESAPAFKDALPLRQRYTFTDRTGANTISLILESTRKAGIYYILGGDGTTVTAEPGRVFLVVTAQVTNIGHQGESRTYTVRTPDPGVFSLQYFDATYAPEEVTSFTTFGEPYGAVTLGRYESREGVIIFDVPASIDIADAYVQVNLGNQGTPVWTLGKTL
jgi:hypothetical protein